MKLLLHACCAPCTIHPLRVLRNDGFEVMGFFYRHNIHPYTECLKRQAALAEYAAQSDFQVIYQEGYEMEEFLRKAAFREANRCSQCYHDRLRAAALVARRGRFDGFSSTLLYSKFQKHDTIKSIGEAVGREVGVDFFYRDFRQGWKEGVEVSKQLGMYRQSYCGCIYSEKDRYYRKPRRPGAEE